MSRQTAAKDFGRNQSPQTVLTRFECLPAKIPQPPTVDISTTIPQLSPLSIAPFLPALLPLRHPSTEGKSSTAPAPSGATNPSSVSHLTHPRAMSLVNLAHVCSHMQNASKARLGMTSVPLSKLHLKLMLGLQKQGFLSSVTVGGPMPPAMADDVLGQLEEAGRPKMHMLHGEKKGTTQHPPRDSPPQEKDDRLLNLAGDASTASAEPTAVSPAAPKPLGAAETHSPHEAAAEETVSTSPWLAYPRSSASTAGDRARARVPRNPALRRLWLGLKYWDNEPVLSRMSLVSKPSQRVWLNSSDIGTIVRGREAGYVKGLTRPGECLFVSTDRGVLEARECAEKRVGGLLLCRVL